MAAERPPAGPRNRLWDVGAQGYYGSRGGRVPCAGSGVGPFRALSCCVTLARRRRLRARLRAGLRFSRGDWLGQRGRDGACYGPAPHSADPQSTSPPPRGRQKEARRQECSGNGAPQILGHPRICANCVSNVPTEFARLNSASPAVIATAPRTTLEGLPVMVGRLYRLFRTAVYGGTTGWSCVLDVQCPQSPSWLTWHQRQVFFFKKIVKGHGFGAEFDSRRRVSGFSWGSHHSVLASFPRGWPGGVSSCRTVTRLKFKAWQGGGSQEEKEYKHTKK